jgi:hypothetical protein
MFKIYLLPFFIITFFYNLDFRYAPISKLRNNGILKILSVATVWSGLIVIIPGLTYQTISFDLLLYKTLFVFIYILMLTLSFDQRDLFIDEKQLKTIPQRCKKKLHLIYFIFFIILIYLSFRIFSGKQLFISLFIVFISTILCSHSNENKSFYYTAFWIEALPVIWFLLLNV